MGTEDRKESGNAHGMFKLQECLAFGVRCTVTGGFRLTDHQTPGASSYILIVAVNTSIINSIIIVISIAYI